MKKSSSMIIAGVIAIAIIISFVALYNNHQDPKSVKIDESDNSTTIEIPEIQEKLDEIEERAGDNYFEPAPRDWQTSGPFQIDRTQYLIGEKIFLRIGELDSDEKGQIAFLRPANETHYSVHQTIPFDGMQKNAFNYYTDVHLSKALGICSVDDIVGEWTVVFRGTSYSNLKFEITDEILPGEEESFESIC